MTLVQRRREPTTSTKMETAVMRTVEKEWPEKMRPKTIRRRRRKRLMRKVMYHWCRTRAELSLSLVKMEKCIQKMIFFVNFYKSD